MPKYSPDDTIEELEKKPKAACGGLREDLKQCLIDSDCVRKVGSNMKVLICGRIFKYMHKV